MDRRTFIIATAVFASVRATLGNAQKPPEVKKTAEFLDGWHETFAEIPKIFLDLMKSVDPIADWITRKRFLRFLERMDRTITSVEISLRTLLRLLEQARCEPESGADILQKAIQEIINLSDAVATLSDQTRLLALSVKPENVRAEAMQVADRLTSLVEMRDQWINEVSSYCGRSPSERTDIRGRIESGLNSVHESRAPLYELIQRTREAEDNRS
jgi:hypothetical protein